MQSEKIVKFYYADSTLADEAELNRAFADGEKVFSYRCVSDAEGSIERIDLPESE